MKLEQAGQMQHKIDDQFHSRKVVPFHGRGNYLRGVQIRELSRFWPIAEPLIHDLMPYGRGRYSVGQIRKDVEEGNIWLWISEPDHACVMLTLIVAYPRMDVMQIFGVAGKLPPGWRSMLASLESYARSIGCRQIELHGRKGWTRKLRDYEPGQIVLTKVL